MPFKHAVLLTLGSGFAVAGIALFARRGATGKNRVRLLGAEFELAGSSLVIFVVGALLVWAGATQPDADGQSAAARRDTAPTTPAPTTSTAAPTAAPTAAVDSHPGPRAPAAPVAGARPPAPAPPAPAARATRPPASSAVADSPRPSVPIAADDTLASSADTGEVRDLDESTLVRATARVGRAMQSAGPGGYDQITFPRACGRAKAAGPVCGSRKIPADSAAALYRTAVNELAALLPGWRRGPDVRDSNAIVTSRTTRFSLAQQDGRVECYMSVQRPARAGWATLSAYFSQAY